MAPLSHDSTPTPLRHHVVAPISCSSHPPPVVLRSSPPLSAQVGNVLFWFFFCIVGQPICVLLYYHDWRVLALKAGSLR